jgi:uncharacterized protein (TIGR02466 family)
MAIENLFPTPIGLYKLDRDLTGKEIDFIKGQETRPNAGNVTSKNNFMLRHKSMTKLRDFIETSLTDYFATVHNPKNKVGLRITQSWCNYTEPGQYHHKHAHPNSFVSGVFYPQANQETDKIYFYRAGYQQIKFPPEKWNIWNSESWWFPVGTGDLILFPSSLEHMVETVKGEQTRISLSFNTFPVGSIGEEVDLTGLQIGEENGALRIS